MYTWYPTSFWGAMIVVFSLWNLLVEVSFRSSSPPGSRHRSRRHFERRRRSLNAVPGSLHSSFSDWNFFSIFLFVFICCVHFSLACVRVRLKWACLSWCELVAWTERVCVLYKCSYWWSMLRLFLKRDRESVMDKVNGTVNSNSTPPLLPRHTHLWWTGP